ncbi:MAG TPA: hypothetical protein VFO19_13630, partial [Vicinamibacterales bacterium]|nr:hypothetical protein [Vicinamibacterales bacterium]
MKVHLRLYTGRPDPEWYITDPATVARVRAWCQAATSPPDAPPPQPHRTGYRGYEIVDDDGRRFHIYRNRIRTPDGKVALAPGVEDELIDTNREELAARYRLDRIRPDDPLLAPIADVPAIDLQSIDGKSAPVFRPARWNDNLDVRGANTCYAYAHDTILENYVMPYRADSDMTRYAIDAALLHDGVRPLG